MPRYNPAEIEPKWQPYWEDNQTFRTPELPTGEKLYVLDMFPYPSGDGLHVGHPEGYTATDIVCRYARMRGKSVLHPMGFDAFGLPAEEHAIQTNTPPRESTEENIANFRRQLKMLGFSYDWERELATTDVRLLPLDAVDLPGAVRHLVRSPSSSKGRPIAELPIPRRRGGGGAAPCAAIRTNIAWPIRPKRWSTGVRRWAPCWPTKKSSTAGASGAGIRSSADPLRQWMLRITAYADRLETDLDELDWSEGIKKLQRDWIGRSTGAEVDFFIGAAGATSTPGRPQRAARAGSRASRATTCCGSTPRDPTRCSAPPTW